MYIKGIWNQVDQYQQFTQPELSIRLQKISKNSNFVSLHCTNKEMVLFKGPNYGKAYKYLRIGFDYKFQVLRSPSLLINPSLSEWKGENIKQIGEILAIKLFRENSIKQCEFKGSLRDLQMLREFLGKRMNQVGFHQYFKVHKLIGQGSFASVYLATRIEDGMKMAVKAFCKNAIYKQEKGKDGLVNEIQIMRDLEHQNLMKLYEVYETHNSIYMGLELLEGDLLYDLHKVKRKFTSWEIYTIMKGLLNGLAYIHEKGLMHRDLKLENILFRQPDNFNSVVIADFGLATYVDHTPYIFTRCGTPGFVAPEVINLQNDTQTYGVICDMFSLGVIFYILTTGQPAFKGTSYNTIVKSNRAGFIDLQTDKLNQSSWNLKDLLCKMLQCDPQNRITSRLAIQHDYFRSFDEDEMALMQTDDDPGLEEIITKLNSKYIRLDLKRLNQSNDDHEICKTQDLKVSQSQNDQDQLNMVMRTPLLIGRVRFTEGSPNQSIQSWDLNLQSPGQDQNQTKWLKPFLL
ncbi:unnamed protein product (macronuclear) [Paramecium tetraurelia]|uniref:Protein kinase domain-containing protein n=1 Tax=Paramecium tetraurelia TaxID=5888 RepID=A0CWB0_PARTE|nr:uncharacterized protein GSPATT00001279001 [Paramecium tetraurelia]CAK75077.1 unnamed protein product [Paramecium tetraurelia]|eukprot:XP_001442474.1 hypothetical protein (macronuclear) [Paramecium tetraurelia strain d4-2]